MTKAKHDLGCASKLHLEGVKCDCKQGLERKTKNKAKSFVKRKNYGTLSEGLADDSMFGDLSYWLAKKLKV